MNKGYQLLTLVMVIGFGFFFTTKLWNEDDRPVQNTYATSDIFNTQGRIRVEKVVYVEPTHSLDIVFEKAYFAGLESEIILETIIHNRDGSQYPVQMEVLNEAHHGNQTRILAHVGLDQLDWYYLELILIDPQTEEMRELTADWRKVERSECLNSIDDYDLSYEFELPSIFETEINDEPEEEYLIEDIHSNDKESHPPIEEPNWDFDILEQRLELSKEDYDRVKEHLDESPDDEILEQSLKYYEEEIKNLQQQIDKMKGDEDGD